MQEISAVLPRCMPTLSHELLERMTKDAEEYRRRQEEQERLKRVERSQVPEAYRSASLDGMPGLARWAGEFGPAKAQKPAGNILLMGVAGCGKTWTAAAIAMKALERCPTVRFVTAPGYLREIQDAMDGRALRSDVFSKYAGCRLLVLDDLGKGKPTEWSATELWELLNSRISNARPTVITTQYDERGLAERLAKGSDTETAQAVASRVYSKDFHALCPGNVDRRRHG